MNEFTMNFFEIFREMAFDSDGNVIAKPFNPAEQNAFDCYNNSRQNASKVNGKAVYECDSLPQYDFTAEFIDLLREAELTEIAVTAENGLLDFLQIANDIGCRITGICSVTHTNGTIVHGIILHL